MEDSFRVQSLDCGRYASNCPAKSKIKLTVRGRFGRLLGLTRIQKVRIKKWEVLLAKA